MPHRPIYRSVERGIGLTPRTNLDTSTAPGPALISNPHTSTLLFVDGPFLIAVVNLLIAITYGATGAFPRTLLSFCAEILEPKVYGLIGH